MEQTSTLEPQEGTRERHWLPEFLRAPPPAPPLTDPTIINSTYRLMRGQVLFWSTFGYGMFYFVRKNYSVAKPVIEAHLGISKDHLGLIDTLHDVVYGTSKFLNGMVADRANARTFMATALATCAAINVLFGANIVTNYWGSTAGFWVFACLWMCNGFFQGMGYPPCARLLTHWFGPKELATKMSFWNTSHALGGGAIVVLASYLVIVGAKQNYIDNWRLVFWVPAVLAGVTAVLLYLFLRDTPESVGLPEVAGTHQSGPSDLAGGMTGAQFKAFIRQRVFGNYYIWIVSAANFFVYTVRLVVLNWAPTFLKEAKGLEVVGSGWMVFSFEMAGLLGMIVTGYLTDKLMRGRAVPLCVISMLCCGGAVWAFWQALAGHYWLNMALLMAAGFFIYGPQALVAVVVANLATKKAAATAVGLTSIFGYGSTLISGWGMGLLVVHDKAALTAKAGGKMSDAALAAASWDRPFMVLLAATGMGAVMFALAWRAKAHGYGDAAAAEPRTDADLHRQP